MSEWQIDLGNPYHAEHPLNRGRLAWWLPMPTHGGIILPDLVTGSGRHGTLTNGPIWWEGEGIQQKAIQFDGTNDHVVAGSPLGGLTTVTVAATVWQRSAVGAQTAGAYICGNTAYNGSFYLGLDGSPTIQAYVSTKKINGTGVGELIRFRAHSTFTASTNMSIYVNGTSIVSNGASIPASVPSHTGVQIGGNTAGGFYSTARIRDVTCWNRVLTVQEMQQDCEWSLKSYIGPGSPLRCYRSRTYFLPTSPPPASIGVIGGGVGAAGCVIGA